MPVSSTCIDITADYAAANPSFAGCFGNMTWAKDRGLTEHPDFYTNYTLKGLTADSSLPDWQCVLANKVGPGGGEGWGCPYPCSASLQGYCNPVTEAPTVAPVVVVTGGSEETPAPTPSPTVAPTAMATAAPNSTNSTPTLAPTLAPLSSTTLAPTTATTTTVGGNSSSSSFGSFGSSSGSSSIEWYWIGLIALALCAAAVAAYFLMSGGKKKRGPEKKKKKRAAAPPPQAVAPTLAPEPQPALTTSQPVYYTTAAPVYQAAPITTAVRAAPVYSAAPVVGSSFVMASAPVATTSRPIASYAVQPAALQGANFDALDRNHDGVISRNEFNAMMR